MKTLKTHQAIRMKIRFVREFYPNAIAIAATAHLWDAESAFLRHDTAAGRDYLRLANRVLAEAPRGKLS